MYRKKERVCEKLDEAILFFFFSLCNSAHDDCFISSQSNECTYSI